MGKGKERVGMRYWEKKETKIGEDGKNAQERGQVYIEVEGDVIAFVMIHGNIYKLGHHMDGVETFD